MTFHDICSGDTEQFGEVTFTLINRANNYSNAMFCDASDDSLNLNLTQTSPPASTGGIACGDTYGSHNRTVNNQATPPDKPPLLWWTCKVANEQDDDVSTAFWFDPHTNVLWIKQSWVCDDSDTGHEVTFTANGTVTMDLTGGKCTVYTDDTNQNPLGTCLEIMDGCIPYTGVYQCPYGDTLAPASTCYVSESGLRGDSLCSVDKSMSTCSAKIVINPFPCLN